MSIQYTGSADALFQISNQSLQHAVEKLHSQNVIPQKFRLLLDDLEGFSGILELQIGAPSATIETIDGRNARINVSSYSRARLLNPDDHVILKEIHGHVKGVVHASISDFEGDHLISLRYSDDPGDTRFQTAVQSGGLPSNAGAAVRRGIHRFISESFHPTQLRIPGTWIADHTGLHSVSMGESSRQREQYLEIGMHSAADHQHQSDDALVNHGLIGNGPDSNNDFALVLKTDYLQSLFIAHRPLIANQVNDITISKRIELVGNVSYRLEVLPAKITLSFEPQSLHLGAPVIVDRGFVKLKIKGKAITQSSFPNFNFEVIDKFQFEIVDGVPFITPLDSNPNLRITSDSIPQLIIDMFLDSRQMEPALGNSRDQFLDSFAPVWQRLFRDFSHGQHAGLPARLFGGFRLQELSLNYHHINILQGAIIVQGTFGFGELHAPFAHFHSNELPQSDPLRLPSYEFNAIRSVVPGGKIDRFRWVLAEPGGVPLIELPEVDRFYTRDVTLINEIENQFYFRDPTTCLNWCLNITGTQNGRDVSDWYCRGCGHGPAIPGDETHGSVRLPGGVTDQNGDIVGHVDYNQRGKGAIGIAQPGLTTLVIKLDRVSADRLLDARRSIASLKKKHPISVLMIIPEGAHNLITRRLKAIKAARFWPFRLIEDAGGAWSKSFGVNKNNLSALISGSGDVVKRFEKFPDTKEVSSLLKSTKFSRQSFSRLISTEPAKLEMGRSVPDFRFQINKSSTIRLDMLLGKHITLMFWTHWSRPSVDRLRTLHKQSKKSGRILIAIHTGMGVTEARKIFKKLKIDGYFVADTADKISVDYGIRFWPTIIHLSRKLTVADIETVHSIQKP